jgi:hypothetical protein
MSHGARPSTSLGVNGWARSERHLLGVNGG